MKRLRSVQFELAVFLMDHHSGQWSRGYRLLCKLRPDNFSSSFCAEMRDTIAYESLVSKFADKV
ncbi:MAG TPA: hypothetical protein VFQ43_04490 [Nitrososphaera sp.]|nr:hypothetical protein [Nitrososphaera sp.]